MQVPLIFQHQQQLPTWFIKRRMSAKYFLPTKKKKKKSTQCESTLHLQHFNFTLTAFRLEFPMRIKAIISIYAVLDHKLAEKVQKLMDLL